jgi:hypothetical protein
MLVDGPSVGADMLDVSGPEIDGEEETEAAPVLPTPMAVSAEEA